MPFGTVSPVGYALETTPGTGVAAASWIPALDAEGDRDLDEQFPELMVNSRDNTRYSLVGQTKYRGKVSFNLFSDMGLALVVGAISTYTPGVLTGTFTTTTSVIIPSFSIELQKGGVQAFRLVGCQANTLKVSAKAGSQVRVDIEYFGTDLATISAGTPSYTTTQPFNWSDTAISIAGADLDTTEFEFTINNNVKELWTLRNAVTSVRRVDSSKVHVTGKFTKYFADTVEYTAYTARTFQALSMTCGGLAFSIPHARLTMHKVPIKVGEFIMQEVDFRGVVDSVAAASFVLTSS